MNNYLIVCLLVSALFAGPSTSVSATVPEYTLTSAQHPGTRIRAEDARSNVPLNRSWKELSKVNQLRFKAVYGDLTKTEQPPYPQNGLQDIYAPIIQKNKTIQATGVLELTAYVDQSGRAIAVTVQKTGSQALARYAKKLVLSTQFDAARCGTERCAMTFPIRINFKH